MNVCLGVVTPAQNNEYESENESVPRRGNPST